MKGIFQKDKFIGKIKMRSFDLKIRGLDSDYNYKHTLSFS